MNCRSLVSCLVVVLTSGCLFTSPIEPPPNELWLTDDLECGTCLTRDPNGACTQTGPALSGIDVIQCFEVTGGANDPTPELVAAVTAQTAFDALQEQNDQLDLTGCGLPAGVTPDNPTLLGTCDTEGDFEVTATGSLSAGSFVLNESASKMEVSTKIGPVLASGDTGLRGQGRISVDDGLTVSNLRMFPRNFTLSSGGVSLANLTGLRIFLRNPVDTGLSPADQFQIPATEMTYVVHGKRNGNPQASVVRLQDAAVGSVDLSQRIVTVDASGNTNGESYSFSLTAEITNLPPVARISSPDVVECTGNGGANVALDASSSSDPDGFADIAEFIWTTQAGIVATGTAETVFLPVGEHLVRLTAIDQQGAISTAETIVTVEDNEPPLLTISISPSCIFPPNHKYVRFDFGDELQVHASDTCFGEDAIIARIEDVGSSEPDNGVGDGDTTDDVRFSRTAACVRSERAGPGSGRTYAVTIDASDPAGNRATEIAEIFVPHNVGSGQPCILPPGVFIDDGDPRCELTTGPSVSEATVPVDTGTQYSGSANQTAEYGCSIQSPVNSSPLVFACLAILGSALVGTRRRAS